MINGRGLIATVAAVFLLTGNLSAQGWTGDQSSLPVPPTEASRQSEPSRGLVALTPVERLKAQSVVDASGTRVVVQLVHQGIGEDLLWQIRWEPGASWGAGTWVAFRDGLGRLREIRIILLEASDTSDMKVTQSGTWLRLVPQGGGSRLDFFLGGRLVTGGWTVPAKLLEIVSSPDAWLWETTGQDLDWGALMPQRRWEDEKVEDLRNRMHKLLSTVPFEATTLWWPDPRSTSAGTSANASPWGAWTHLPGDEAHAQRGLGPWGVSLWASTGILRGWKGEYPTWAGLLTPRIELPGYSRAMEQGELLKDPGFAVDWIRNLGLEVQKVLYPNRPRTDTSADVVGLPFLSPVTGAGYAVDDFPALVHLLAVTRPGQAYLVSLSTQDNSKGVSSAVTFREPAVLLPWIGKDNRVRVAFYAGPKEMNWEQWILSAPPPRKGVRPDHLLLTALPLPPKVELPLLPAR